MQKNKTVKKEESPEFNNKTDYQNYFTPQQNNTSTTQCEKEITQDLNEIMADQENRF